MNIDIITGSRAEFGIMKTLIAKLSNDNYFNMKIIVTGMHLEKKYGYTKENILEDGFNIFKEIPSDMSRSTDEGILNSVEKTFDGFKNFYSSRKPDSVIILGDRYEVFAAAQVCAFLKIPIIHIHGGEKTEGNFDEFIRHSITKMSKLHFVSTKEYRNRVIQLGEDPKTVFDIGSLGVENIIQMEIPSLEELNSHLNIVLKPKEYVVSVFHPETLSNSSNDELLKALSCINKNKKIIFIGLNSDTGSDHFSQKIKDFIDIDPKTRFLFTSIQSKFYYRLLKSSVCLIGNSSSGIIEAPSLKIYTINIGKRQQGRLKGETIFDVENNYGQIIEIYNKIRKMNFMGSNPYFKENASDNLIKLIKNNEKILMDPIKKFYDLNIGGKYE